MLFYDLFIVNKFVVISIIFRFFNLRSAGNPLQLPLYRGWAELAIPTEVGAILVADARTGWEVLGFNSKLH